MSTKYDYTNPPIGATFHRLTVLNYSHLKTTKGSGNMHYWNCRCICGTERAYRSRDLVRGRIHGCGCYQKERVAARFLKHGECKKPEYVGWQNIKQRCLNPENREFHNYGERGISICEGWRDFKSFLADVGRRPDPSLSLDRVNNEGHYSCGHCWQCKRDGWLMNVRWATKQTQTDNRRITKNSARQATAPHGPSLPTRSA